MDIIGFFLLQVALLALLRPTGFRRTVERPRRHARNLLASQISVPGCCSTIGGEETRQTRQPKDDENIFTSGSTSRESAHKQEGLDQKLACGDWDRDVADRPHANARPAPSARSRRQAHAADLRPWSKPIPDRAHGPEHTIRRPRSQQVLDPDPQ